MISKIQAKFTQTTQFSSFPYEYDQLYVLKNSSAAVRIIYVIDKYRIAFGDDSGNVEVWNIEDCCKLFHFNHRKRPVTGIICLHSREYSGLILIVSSNDNCITTIRLDEYDVVASVYCPDTPFNFLYETSSKREFLTAGSIICLRNELSDVICTYDLKSAQNFAESILELPNSRFAIAVKNEIVVLHLRKTDEAVLFEEQMIYKCSSILSLQSLVLLSESMFASSSENLFVLLWDVNDLMPVRILKPCLDVAEYLNDMDNSLVCTISIMEAKHDFLVLIIGPFAIFYNVVNNTYDFIIKCQTRKVTCIQFCQNFLITGGINGSISKYLFDEQTMESAAKKNKPVIALTEIFNCNFHSGSISNIICNARTFIISTGKDGLVNLWKNSMVKLRTQHRQTI